MRRADREITDGERIDAVIERCDCCRLGLCDGARAYIVPMSFVFVREQGARVLYFHSATEGRKLEILRKNPFVCFEMDTDRRFFAGESAAQSTMLYCSVMGEGEIAQVEDAAEKRRVLGLLLARYRKTARAARDAFSADGVCVLRLRVESISAKENKQ